MATLVSLDGIERAWRGGLLACVRAFGSPSPSAISTSRGGGSIVDSGAAMDINGKAGGAWRYMNCKAAGNQAYVPTELEHIANVITHGLCILPSLLGLVFLVQQASNRIQYFSALVYGFSLVALFSVSTTFHSIFYLGRFRYLKEILHRCDRAVIYLFIAASYTPWLNLKVLPPSCFAVHVRWLVWFMAVLGITYQQLFHERYKWLETILYIIMGVSPAIAIVEMEEASGLNELALGGLLYMTGVIFFKSDGRIPCAHAIWHMFVGVGALCHYLAVSRYLMGKHNEMYIHQNY